MSQNYESIISSLESLLNEFKECARMENQMENQEVLVRWWPSVATSIYHQASAPCGRVHILANFRSMPKWQAKRMGLMRCPGCRPWKLS
jgi:hypothetical protein